MVILENVTFGYRYFETALTLRESMIINSMIFNSEVWYGTSISQIEHLEEVDKMYLRKILDAPISTPAEALYLEMGCIPIGFIITARRVNYLHYLVHLKDTEMLHTFFEVQWKWPCKYDWTETVKEDLKLLNIDYDMVKSMKQEKFSKLVKERCMKVALSYLLDLKQRHSKMDNLKYSELKQQNIYKSKEIYSGFAKKLFKWRTRMFDLKNNFCTKYADLSCPLCFKHIDKDEALLTCETILSEKTTPKIDFIYKELFGEEIQKVFSIGKLLDEAWTIRNLKLDKISQ